MVTLLRLRRVHSGDDYPRDEDPIGEPHEAEHPGFKNAAYVHPPRAECDIRNG